MTSPKIVECPNVAPQCISLGVVEQARLDWEKTITQQSSIIVDYCYVFANAVKTASLLVFGLLLHSIIIVRGICLHA